MDDTPRHIADMQAEIHDRFGGLGRSSRYGAPFRAM
jgi:hypothetical protein